MTIALLSSTFNSRLIAYRRLFIVAALTALVASCATQPPPLPTPDQRLQTLDSWRMEGKLGFRSPEKNGSAWINWLQIKDSYQLQLSGPFGAAATRISGDSGHATLSQSGRDDIHAASGEELSEWLFGWAFPVRQMSSWIKGAAAASPQPTALVVSSENLLSTLNQSGWQLTFSNYRQQGEWVLPGRIQGSQGDYAFTLIIKQWDLSSRAAKTP
ncbi:MAG: lipoprotein insertase outer membrane protein LolB [Porticoccaceae bacterium]|jgi:outer membrane lipoprotein LolB